MIYLGNQAVGVDIFPTGAKVVTGTTTINSASQTITVQTGLGQKPDLAAIWIDNVDSTKIPNGSCVKSVHQRVQYTGTSVNMPSYSFQYIYKHATSGNFLYGYYNSASDSAGAENSFTFSRGVSDWQPLDTDGNAIVYRWVAVALN